MIKSNNFYFYNVAIEKSSNIFSYKSTIPLDIGNIVEVELRNRKVKAYVVEQISEPSFECKEINKVIYKFDLNKQKIINFISNYYFAGIGEIFPYFNYLNLQQTLYPIQIKTNINLSDKQNQALNFIKKHRVSLLFGDTGSGKTEIYMKYIEEIVNQNKQVLYLLPEIAITSQIEQRLKDKFGSIVEVWHSKISKKKKEETLRKIYTGEVRIIVGAMSAIFLPLNLGAIIVDEEHDDSFKLSKRPFFNVKDLAIYFSKIYNINVILGSATPLISDLYKFPYFRLKGTYHSSEKTIYYVNEFNNKIKEKIKNNKKQTIIFTPTRANYKTTICKNCGKTIKCPNCDISLSLHKDYNKMQCHYCNYTTAIPTECPYCHSTEFENKRKGTSEIKSELEEEFPNLKISKFDRDIITSKSRIDKILKDFANKKIDVLIGTQMLSKGLNFLNVNLSIILDIDFILNENSYRANEKAFALVKQISGRAARKGEGEVIIQTLNKEFFDREYEDFYQEEIEFREMIDYPPFSRIIKIEFSNKDKEIAFNKMNQFLKCIGERNEIIGFSEAPIFKLKNRYRYNILLKGRNLHKIIYPCYKKDKDISIEVDPLDI